MKMCTIKCVCIIKMFLICNQLFTVGLLVVLSVSCAKMLSNYDVVAFRNIDKSLKNVLSTHQCFPPFPIFARFLAFYSPFRNWR